MESDSDTSSDEEVNEDQDHGAVAVANVDDDDADDDLFGAPLTQHVENSRTNNLDTPKRRPPPPPQMSSTYDIKDQNWRRQRPVMISETVIEFDDDD
jgi:hypothetical protein